MEALQIVGWSLRERWTNLYFTDNKKFGSTPLSFAYLAHFATFCQLLRFFFFSASREITVLWLRQLLIRHPLLHCLPPPTSGVQQHSFLPAPACVWQQRYKVCVNRSQKASPGRDPPRHVQPLWPKYTGCLPLPSQTLTCGALCVGRLEKMKHRSETAVSFHSRFCRWCDALHCKLFA